MVAKLDGNTKVAGIYASPQTKGRLLESIPNKVKDRDGSRTIVVGDTNARHKAWDKLKNARWRTVHSWAKR